MVTNSDGSVAMPELVASESQSAPFVPFTIVTLYTYVTSGPIKGDLASTTQEWVDAGNNVIGKAVTTSYQYDANGNRTNEIKTRTVAAGTDTVSTVYTYDAQNRVVATTVREIPSGGSVTNILQTSSVVYSDVGKQASSVDAAGRTTTMIYDYTGNLIETQYPDGTVTRTSYDAFGRQDFEQERAMTNSSGATTAPATHSTYDASGRVIQTEKFDSVTLTNLPADTNYFAALAAYEPQRRMAASAPGIC